MPSRRELNKIKISVIAAVDNNGALGYNGDLLYHVKEDLRHFKDLTYGDTVIMGYNTFLSLKRPDGLPNRFNVVLYNGDDIAEIEKLYPNVSFEKSIDSALRWAFIDALANDRKNIWFIGGASVYREAVEKYADCIELTIFDAFADKADVYFPMGLVTSEFKEASTQHDYSEENKFHITYMRMIRKHSRPNVIRNNMYKSLNIEEW